MTSGSETILYRSSMSAVLKPLNLNRGVVYWGISIDILLSANDRMIRTGIFADIDHFIRLGMNVYPFIRVYNLMVRWLGCMKLGSVRNNYSHALC